MWKLLKFHERFVLSIAAVLAIGFVGVIAPASAQETLSEAELDAARYELIERGDKIVRLDRQTGAMSLCDIVGRTLVCQMAADDRVTMAEEIEKLEERIANLEQSAQAQEDNPKSEETPKSPEREKFNRELDKAMDFAKDAMRRFHDLIEDLKNDYAEKDAI